MCKVGTLKELNVKPGDVVECVYGYNCWTVGRHYAVDENCEVQYDTRGYWSVSPQCTFRIISRASDAPKLWHDMTPKEKGALLLAHHEGKVIEVFCNNTTWLPIGSPTWINYYAYRVRQKPKVETHKHVVFAHGERRFTEYKTIGGKVEWSSFKVVE